jgi:hypothetical protein
LAKTEGRLNDRITALEGKMESKFATLDGKMEKLRLESKLYFAILLFVIILSNPKAMELFAKLIGFKP